MTLSEFKAWFDGFTEAMDRPPDERQWERVKAKVAEIGVDRAPFAPEWTGIGTAMDYLPKDYTIKANVFGGASNSTGAEWASFNKYPRINGRALHPDWYNEDGTPKYVFRTA